MLRGGNDAGTSGNTSELKGTERARWEVVEAPNSEPLPAQRTKGTGGLVWAAPPWVCLDAGNSGYKIKK